MAVNQFNSVLNNPEFSPTGYHYETHFPIINRTTAYCYDPIDNCITGNSPLKPYFDKVSTNVPFNLTPLQGKSARYGFNGKEKLNELEGEGDAYDYGARMYDARLGRWLSAKTDEVKSSYLSKRTESLQYRLQQCGLVVDNYELVIWN